MLEEICKKYDTEIKEILNALDYCFLDELDQDSFEMDVVCCFEDHYKKPFNWDNGATKGVLIFKNYGFVIKIPFTYCDGCELCGAYEGDTDWDYCSQEENRYLKAKKNGLSQIFLQTSCIGEVDEHPIYIQLIAEPLDKIDYNDSRKSNHSKSSRDEIKVVKMINEENDYSWINGLWEADVFTMYGGKYYHRFKKYIKDNCINDLRDANVGYVGLKPVILDYAGFDS